MVGGGIKVYLRKLPEISYAKILSSVVNSSAFGVATEYEI